MGILLAIIAVADVRIVSAAELPATRSAVSAEFRQQAFAISGTAKDSTGKAIADVRVTIAELGIQVYSDVEGRYRFTDIRPGRYTLVARKVGFLTPAAVVVSPTTDATHDFVLSRSGQRLEPVTVTATSSPSDLRLSSRSIGVVSQDELRSNASISLAHTLTNLAGVRSVSTGLQTGKPMIRGLFGARVLTLEDGLRLEDYSWSDEDAPSIDARLAQRVEVIRGPASVLYGSDALGGVVNVIPEALPTTAIGTNVYRLSLEGYGSSNNFESGGSVRVEGAHGRLGWRVFGTGRFSGNIHTPDGEIVHSGFFAITGQAAIGLRSDHGNTTLRISNYGGEFQLHEANDSSKKSTPANPIIADTSGPVRRLFDSRVQLVHEHVFESLRLELKTQLQRHSLAEVSDDCLPQVGQAKCTVAELAASKDKPAFDLLLNTSTADVLLHHGTTGNVHGTFGVSGMYQSNGSNGPIFLIPAATTSSVGAFALEQLRAGIVTLEGGARVDHRSLNADPNTQIFLAAKDSRKWNAATFNLGATVQATPMLAFTGNVGSGWRAPTLFDLYTNGPNLAEGRFEIGDYALKQEQDLTGEVGIRVTGSRGRLEANVFQSTIDNYIYTTPTGQTMSSLPLFRHVQNDARFTGGEASGEVIVAAPLSLNARYDYVQATNRTTNLPLPLIPPSRAAVGATYRSAQFAGLHNFGLHGEVETVAKQTRLDANDIQTGAYTLINASANGEMTFGKRDVRFDLRVQNAGNVAYKDFLSRYKRFALDQGVNVQLRLSYGW
ncbi:MAG: TonB-dependent receptor [Gemmatimonadaceae bacterium]